MKSLGWILSVVGLTWTTAARAQPDAVVPPPPPPPQSAVVAPPAAVPITTLAVPSAIQPYWRPAEPYSAWGHRAWVSNEYLLWWIKKGPLPVPLITSSNAADVGTIGAPSTQVLFGGNRLDYGSFFGYRLGFGTWIDGQRTIGVESRWLFLEHRSAIAGATSDVNGNPTLAIPIFDPRPSGSLLFGDQPAGFPLPGEAGLFITAADSFSGGIVVSSYTELWGTEVNALCNLVRNQTWNLNLVSGFRFLNLNENLLVQTTSLGLAGAGTFAGTLFETRDRFHADNGFYGGQLGLQTGFQWGCFTANVNGLVALGSTHQIVTRNGGTLIQNSGDASLPSGFYPGGLLAVPTNIGQEKRNSFTVVPELQFQVGYNVSRAVRLFMGYSFLYWSNVVRPGDQIDRVVNPTQVPGFGGLALEGPARPAPIFQQTDFWAQGLNFGVSLQF